VLTDSGEEVTAQRLSGRNIWKERLEFYHSAQPRTEEEENIMVKRALEESKKLEEERQRRILDETTNHIHALYALQLFVYFLIFRQQHSNS